MAKTTTSSPVEVGPGSPGSVLGARPGLRVRPRRPVRAFVGGLVVVAAAVAALALYARVGDRREVLMLTRTVLAGEQLVDADLRVVSIGSDGEFAAVAASERGSVVGQFARVRLASGSLLVADQVQPTRLVAEGRVLASVTVTAGGVPVGLRERSEVALVVTPGAEVAEVAGALPVVVPATVAAVPGDLTEVVGDVEAATRTMVPLSVEIPPRFARLVGSAEAVSVMVIDPSEPYPAGLDAEVAPTPGSDPADVPTSTTAAAQPAGPSTTAAAAGGGGG